MSIFTTTRWSLVLAARGNGRDAGLALEALCRAYRPAVLAYIRARGHERTEAEDLTQTFFERFLVRQVHAAADPARGRFRTFLRTTLQRYLINEGIASQTQKRGGGKQPETLGDWMGEGGTSEALSPDEAFDLAWAVTVCDRALANLREEATATGRGEQFAVLEPFLLERPEQREYLAVAERLGMRANTVAVAVRRLRERLRELIGAELADTVDGQDGVEAEKRALQALLAAH